MNNYQYSFFDFHYVFTSLLNKHSPFKEKKTGKDEMTAKLLILLTPYFVTSSKHILKKKMKFLMHLMTKSRNP